MAVMEEVLHYSDIFRDNVPDIVESVSKMNMHKTISIICELIQTKNYRIPVDLPFMGHCNVPYESAMKNLLWPMESSEDLQLRSWYFNKRTHIYCEQYLLILLKYVLAYGNLESLEITEYTIDSGDYRSILLLCLAIGEQQHIKFSSVTDQSTLNHFVYGNYHINRNASVAASFVRTYYLFSKVCNNQNILDSDVQGEYRNYNEVFESKYGFSIIQLINSLMWELNGYFNQDLRIAYSSLWKSIERQYSNTSCMELERIVISSLSKAVEEYREWAKSTIDEEWDFSEFLTHPFLADKSGNYISISEYTIRNALFFNVYWMIRECYPLEDKNAMAFYGRLYEKYLQDITVDSLKRNEIVDYIPEFKYNKGKKERRSSDAYFKKDNKLIIIEMKGFMILIDSLIKNEKVEKNYKKLFVDPVRQAYECFEDIQVQGGFCDIQQIYIISVTMDNVTSVPDYISEAKEAIRTTVTPSKMIDCYNFNTDEYELFLSAIEEGSDAFEILDEYTERCNNDPLFVFQNYIREKNPSLGMTRMMHSVYEEFSIQLKAQFGIEIDRDEQGGSQELSDEQRKELEAAQHYMDSHPVLHLSPGDLKRENIDLSSYLERFSKTEQNHYKEYYSDEL